MADRPPEDRGIVTVEALRASIGRPGVWLAIATFEALLAVAPALAYLTWMRGAIDHHYAPGTLVANLSSTFRFDHRTELDALNSTTGQMGAVLALLAMLSGCFAAGGWLQVYLERTHGESLRRFFFGGARYFWRFVRVLALTLILMSLASWIALGGPWNTVVLHWWWNVPVTDFEKLETLASENMAVRLRFAQDGFHALLVSIVYVWGDYTRTRLALHDTTSATWAGLSSAWTLLRHPVRVLRPHVALFLVEATIVVSIGWFARSIEANIVRKPTGFGIALLFGIGLVVLVWRVILRGARYHAAAQVSRDVVRPIARPDPWKAIGGPGGPRYPIGGDEYSVAL